MNHPSAKHVALLLILIGTSGCFEQNASEESGVKGKNSVAYSVRKAAPIEKCPVGGISVDAGVDGNANGALDVGEVTSTQYLCNGGDGQKGVAALVLPIEV